MKTIALFIALLPFVASATPGTYDSITSAVDFANVATAVVAIAALICVALVAIMGGQMVLDMIAVSDAREEDRARGYSEEELREYYGD